MKIEKLLTEAQIQARVEEMAQEISRDVPQTNAGEKPPVALILANGAIFFAADLLRKLRFETEIQVVRVASYAGTQSNGAPEIVGGISPEKFRGRRVLVIDDVLDTGHTLAKVREHLCTAGAEDVRICVLLDKPSRRVVDFKADVSLFTIPDHFVIGYGLDCGEHYRNLPYIAEYGE